MPRSLAFIRGEYCDADYDDTSDEPDVINWTSYQYAGLNNITVGKPLDSTLALASASTYVTLNLLDSIYEYPPRWSHVIENSAYVTVIDMDTSKSTVLSYSVQLSAILDMYVNAKENGPRYVKLAEGMLGAVNLTLPMLATSCSQGPGNSCRSGRWYSSRGDVEAFDL